ncbi:MAG: hypothetical protein NWF09_06515 [Candidatus Bathyarchaeota archaeon]|nr:hypothetical protein [Candidatus Bathyarchaeota archaeon]
MKRAILFAAIAIFLLLIGLIAVLAFNSMQKPFHVGVTFGGSTAAEAKQLIDRVKDYTNLFVVQSGPLQMDIPQLENTELEKICDCAVEAGLDIIIYVGAFEIQANTTVAFINAAQERWGSHFLGLYYGDEPGGKMLDDVGRLDNIPNLGNVTKDQRGVTIRQTNGSIEIVRQFDFFGQISLSYSDSVSYNMTTYFPDGTITVFKGYADYDYHFENCEFLVYLPNGTVTLQRGLLPSSPSVVTDRGDISQFEPYQKVWDSRPFQTMDDMPAVATSYVKTQQAIIDRIHNQVDVKLFTSDYALYWWDYLSGYDVVLAQLGWNNTVAQEIGLVRGAANLQGKSWGVILTWKYKEPPYLASGEEIYSQMRTAYECGAEYVVVFNYAENMTGPYGILQLEHFDALERFWRDVVQNPFVWHGTVKAEVALVLPKDYGWGMRNPQDTIWGLWSPDSAAEQIWTQLQSKLQQYGSKLDIVYDNPAYPVAGKYPEIIYWNQTG